MKEETTFHTKQGAPLNELSGYKRFLLVLAKKNPNTAKSSRKKAAWTLVVSIITQLNRELAIANTMGSDAAEHRRLRIEPLESSLGVALDKLFDLDADAPLSIQGKFTSETDHLRRAAILRLPQVDGEQVAIPQSNAVAADWLLALETRLDKAANLECLRAFPQQCVRLA